MSEYVLSAKRNGVRVYRTEFDGWSESMSDAWIVSQRTAEHLMNVRLDRMGMNDFEPFVSNLRVVKL